jgi:dihydrofolate reductase
VDATIEDGDALFPEWDREGWQLDEASVLSNYREEGDEYPYDFKVFRREE